MKPYWRIGDRFMMPDSGPWQVTDIGNRVVVAVLVPDDASWLDGPPYALAETVFDEDDQEVMCRAFSPDPDKAEMEQSRAQMRQKLTEIESEGAATLTKVSHERAAKAMAQAINGGDWEADYTEAQRDVWRRRVLIAMGDA